MSLTNTLATLPSASIESTKPEYPVIKIDHPLAQARIALHGAHLIDWTPSGHRPVIYTSPEAIYTEGKAIRGGVPICWPWFNAHPTDQDKPSHGFARNRFWTLTAAEESADAVTLTFTLPSDESTRELFPHNYTLNYQVTIGSTLDLRLTVTNEDDEAIQVGGALHSYFAISFIPDVTLSGLEKTNYIDTVGTEAIRRQDELIHIAGEVDRIYFDTSDTVKIHDPAFERNIIVSKSGSGTTVVWNPWYENSQALGDLPDLGYQDFVCIEAANARADTRTLEPGASHTLSQTISVEASQADEVELWPDLTQ